MARFAFITGAGRCGTTLMTSLLDGSSAYNLFPGEVGGLLEGFLEDTHYTGRLDLRHGPAPAFDTRLLGHILGVERFGNAAGRARIEAALETLARDEPRPGLAQVLETLAAAMYDDGALPIVYDVRSPHPQGYLEHLPDSVVVHMVRHPLDQLNSHFRFLHRDPNTSGGEFPGRWNMAGAIDEIIAAFDAAARLKDEPRAAVVRMEDLQDAPEATVRRVLDLMGADFQAINARITRAGQPYDSFSTHRAASTVFRQDHDWSCLSASDLYYATRVPHAGDFYDIEPAPYAPNRFAPFLARAFGLKGRNRKKPKGPVRAVKVAALAVSYYLQDLRHKFYLRERFARAGVPGFSASDARF